jgi:hypothetical protein
MRRPPNIESERLLLVALLPEEMEALIARDFERLATLSGLSFPPDNPDIGDLGWQLREIHADDKHFPWRMRVIVERSSRRSWDRSTERDRRRRCRNRIGD